MKRLLLTALIAFGPIGSTIASEVRVVDGDTIDVGSVRYRLHGIDAPEAGQKCLTAVGGTWACGKAATSAMEKLVLGKDIVCDHRGDDGYDRTLSVCTVDDVEINAAMIKQVLAWAFIRYSSDYVDFESVAKSSGIGIWQAPTQTAWDYRAERWAAAQQQASNPDCPIKGNISKNGHIYHAPWSLSYDVTVVTASKGERWFCDEAEAVAAGWRAPRWGR